MVHKTGGLRGSTYSSRTGKIYPKGIAKQKKKAPIINKNQSELFDVKEYSIKLNYYDPQMFLTSLEQALDNNEQALIWLTYTDVYRNLSNADLLEIENSYNALEERRNKKPINIPLDLTKIANKTKNSELLKNIARFPYLISKLAVLESPYCTLDILHYFVKDSFYNNNFFLSIAKKDNIDAYTQMCLAKRGTQAILIALTQRKRLSPSVIKVLRQRGNIAVQQYLDNIDNSMLIKNN